MSGEDFELNNDTNILSINSPRKRVGGPYHVVHKNVTERWALVALKWDSKPCLGLRWFHGNAGNPLSRANPTGMIIPNELNTAILNGLPLEKSKLQIIVNFLASK